jgi:hypothetical protein
LERFPAKTKKQFKVVLKALFNVCCLSPSRIVCKVVVFGHTIGTCLKEV